MQRVVGVLAGVCLLAHIAPVQAESVFTRSGFASGHDTHTVFPYEHIDPASGNLLLIQTDLVLPGNAGLDLVVQRVYNSKVHPLYDQGGNTALEERSWVGVGWRLHFGRVINPTSTTSGATQIELGDGSRHPLYTTGAFPEGWISKDFIRYDRGTATAKFPNGLVYTFGHVTNVGGLLGDVRYVTQIADPHGNTLVFTYAASPAGGLQSIVQNLGGGQTRTVTFAINPTTNALGSMTYNGQTYSFTTQATTNPTGHALLLDTQRPGNLTRWSYQYASGLTGELTKLVAPSEGEVSFTYANATRTVGGASVLTRVVTQRQTQGTYVTGGTWSFAYGQGAQANKTVVTTPCGTLTYAYKGFGTTGPFPAWQVGLLDETTVEQGGTVFERHTMTYQPSVAISPDPIPPDANGNWGDPAVYNALSDTTWIYRGPQAWRTTVTYRSSNYNDYGSPWEVRAYDEGNSTYRLTSTTYQYGFTPWIVGHVASTTYQHFTTADQGTDTYSYDLTTGFLTSATVLGVTTTFAPNAQGNVASVTDALSHQTTFQYSWGVVNVITSPTVPPPGVTPAPTTRVINQDGTVASETVGGLQTTYTYDALMRLGSVQPPFTAGLPVQPLNILRDSLHSRQETQRRGGNLPGDPHYDTVTDLDSFGRPRRVTDPAGLYSEMTYDACGRQTFARRPSANGAAAGIETTYDPLGRVTQVKDLADNSITTTTYDVLDGSDVVDVRVTDAEGKTTKYIAHSFGGPGGQLEKVIDADLKITTYTYNRLGTLLSVTGPGTAGSPGPVRTWVVGTPANGRVTSASEPEGGTTTFQYNAVGQVTSTTDALAQTFGLTYDTNNRLTFRDAPGTDADLTLEYDALGRLWRQTVGTPGSGTAIVTLTGFDPVGRLSQRTDSVDGHTFISTYTYDSFDRPSTMTYPRPYGTGRAVTYGYDTTTGRLSSVTQGGNPFAGNFSYDNEGRLWRVDTGPVRHDLTFDARSRASHLTLGKIGAAAELDLTYAYNRVNHVTGVTDSRPGQSQSYDYDVLYRLKRATGPWGTVDWTYDATGNRLSETRNGVQATTYSYSGANRLAQTLVGGTPTETLAYDAIGRTTSDGRGTYGYFADGPVQSVTTGSGTSATYAYDTDGWRIKRVINGKTTYTLRSPGQQTLSVFEVCGGGTPAWQRDEIYAGGRLLGAVRTTATAPTVRFAVGTSSVTEPDSGTTTHTVSVVLGTSAALTCPVTVNYETVAGSATGGVDYVAASGTLTFPIGSVNGATLSVPLTVRGDTLPEANEIVVLLLRSATGATVIQPTDHEVTIVNNDTLPTLSTSNLTVGEAGSPSGYAQFTVTLNKASEQTITATYATANGTALTAANDYTSTSGVLTFDPGQTSKTVNVPISDDSWAEPTETFTFTLSSPTNATLGTAVGTASITDNDGTRVPLDLTLNGVFLSDLDASTTTFDHLLLANPQASPISVKVTYTRPNGTGATDALPLTLAANERRTIGLSGSSLAAAGPVSIAVQSLTAGATVEADHAQYWATNWNGGRSTEGVPGSDTWYFAEGSVGYFEEYLTVHNLEPQAIQVVFTFYRPDGSTASHTATIFAGPGRLRLKVRDLNLSLGDHGAKVVATRLDTGAPAKVVAERTMEWETDRREGHSTPGTASLSSAWQFAEGNKGGFDTYLAFLNPSNTNVTARVLYRHENLVDYAYDVAVPAHARATLLTPAGVPAGGFALSVTVLEGVPIAVERMLYGGDAWTVGTAGVGCIGAGTTWRFAEGITTTPFDTYFQVLNLGFSTTVTFTFVTEAGATITQGLWVLGGGGRAVLLADSVSGLSTGTFKTTVTSSQPIVVERATYWASGGGSALMAGGGGAGLEALALEDGAAAVEKGGGGGGSGGPTRPGYHDLTKPEAADAISAAREVGGVSPDETARVAGRQAEREAALGETKGQVGLNGGGGGAQASSSLPWIGGHLTLGRRP